MYNETFSLFEITANTLPLFLSGRPEESPLPGHIVLGPEEKLERVHEIERKLNRWLENSPASLGVEPEDLAHSHPAAPVIDLHLVYHTRYIATQSILLRSMTPPIQSDQVIMTTNKLIDCSRKIANLFSWLQRSMGGLEYFTIHQTQGASLLVYHLIDFLDHAGVPDIFNTLIVTLAAASRRWLICRGIMRTIWMTLMDRDRGLVSWLRKEMVELLKLSALDSWGPEDLALLESHIYPNDAPMSVNGVGPNRA